MALPSVLDEIDRLFDELVRRPWGKAGRQVTPLDVRQVEDGWVVTLPVEDLSAKDLQVHVEGNWLTVSGHSRRAEEHRQGKTGWSRKEQEFSLSRTIALPAGADPSRIDATIEKSTLTIHIRRRKP
ncbi:MAG: heat shock protein Hsp20 [Deltaproteobacteria bacterium]|nr:heat shock protein Hsp20 [Deltaproteobacteria bacterium]